MTELTYCPATVYENETQFPYTGYILLNKEQIEECDKIECKKDLVVDIHLLSFDVFEQSWRNVIEFAVKGKKGNTYIFTEKLVKTE